MMFCPSSAMYGDVLGALLFDLAAEGTCRGQSRRGRSRGCAQPSPAQHPSSARRPCFVRDDPASVFGSRAFDVAETDEAYLIFLDVPGYSREDIHITLEGDRLLIAGKPNGSSKESVPHHRRPRAPLQRSWQMPSDVVDDGIEAKLDNGELVITLPKAEAPKPQRFTVPVTGADPAPAEPADTPQLLQDANLPMSPSSHEAALPGPPSSPFAAAAVAQRPAQPPLDRSIDTEQAAVGPSRSSRDDGDDAESDGSWEDVPDEEEARRRAKGKAPAEGPVLEEIERQQAALAAAGGVTSDSE